MRRVRRALQILICVPGLSIFPTLALADLLDDEDQPKSTGQQTSTDTSTSTQDTKAGGKSKDPATQKPKEAVTPKSVKPHHEPAKTGVPVKGAKTVAPAASESYLPPSGKNLGQKGAASEDSKQPIHFESNGLRALKEKGTAELLENVVVTQGTLRLEADKAKIFYDDDIKDVVRVIAEGNVKIFKIDEESGEKIKAYGDRVEFDNKARTVVLDGNARLWRGADLVRGKKISYELDTGWVKADRVAGEVHPSEDKK